MFIQTNKIELRKWFREKRNGLVNPFRLEASLSAANALAEQDIFKKAQHLAIYLAYGNEFNAEPIIRLIWQNQKHCYLPIITPKNTLNFAPYYENAELIPNRFSILEPSTKTPHFPINQLDIIFLPLVAFDEKGHRLGTGGGFYDKTLAPLLDNENEKKPLLIGLAYQIQKADLLPQDPWDLSLDGVLTEKGLQWF